ncbi:hypothetical protein [Leifsonia sp. P73]|uniref:hypothetical protein n=1 Tax=Leifsonia sp. P73 TaxID=3423959 RepID=UPI003DA269E3
MEALSIAALVVAVISAGVAIWQGVISRQQLKLAQDTEKRTESALEEIRRVTGETKQISENVKQNIDERITKILDNKLLAEQQAAASSNAASEALLQMFMQGMQNQQKPGGGQ